MQNIKTRLFEGREAELDVFNSQAVIDQTFTFITIDECIPGTLTETEFEIPSEATAYFRTYNERQGRLIKDLVLVVNQNTLIANFSVNDMTFEDLGEYYYEIGYTNNGYDMVLRYGILVVI